MQIVLLRCGTSEVDDAESSALEGDDAERSAFDVDDAERSAHAGEY